jgi:signal transduction histidine kinase
LGLGLSIAKQLVELHGGTIAAVSSGEGTGATFTIRMPIAPSRDEVAEASHLGGEAGTLRAAARRG